MPEKKKPSFLKSLRFRILIILVILGIVPSVIVAHVMVAAYESKAVAVRKQTVEKQCDILCNLLIKENYMNDSSSQTVNSKLELLSNVYDGRILPCFLLMVIPHIPGRYLPADLQGSPG